MLDDVKTPKNIVLLINFTHETLCVALHKGQNVIQLSKQKREVKEHRTHNLLMVFKELNVEGRTFEAQGQKLSSLGRVN